MTVDEQRAALLKDIDAEMNRVDALSDRAVQVNHDAWLTLNGAWHKLREARRLLEGSRR